MLEGTFEMPIRLSSIVVYPFKSLGGISLDRVDLDQFGPKHDRRWMLVDPDNTFLTQRQHPQMALIQPEFRGDQLALKAPGMPPFMLPLEPDSGSDVEVNLFEEHCQALETEAAAGEWLSAFLGFSCRPVFMPQNTHRVVDPEYSPERSRTSFTDGFPFLLLGEESLADLNGRLAEPVGMERFRPNLVIRGAAPFAEDDWRQIRIGNVVFQVAKPCSRCRVTTVDSARGEFSGKEPLKTLATYRNVSGKTLFGQNLIHRQVGRLQVGNEVSIVDPLDH
jgi:hypothetical protein